MNENAASTKTELGLELSTKRKKKLEQIKDKCEEDILAGEIEELISRGIIVLMEREIEKENAKLK